MQIGIVGSGDVAQALAKGFLGRGDSVRLGTRTPTDQKHKAWAKSAGAKASVGTFSEAAKFGELVVVATHGVVTPEALKAAGPENFAGKVVIDVTNPLVFEPNKPPQLAFGFTDSSGERVQRALPKAKVVKSFNIVGSPHMVHPTFPGGPPTMFICGNDPAAKKAVEKILQDFGWSTIIDIGDIEGARLLEPLCILWVTAALKIGSWDNAFKLLQK
jgi:8-hydroxy-5-deazaflavin:NADPH oxidoreductase